MSCNFNSPFQGDATSIMNKAKSAVESQGGNFTGDTSAGLFDISLFGNKIAGSYIVNGQTLEVIIDEKPFMIPCNAIEKFLTKQIG